LISFIIVFFDNLILELCSELIYILIFFISLVYYLDISYYMIVLHSSLGQLFKSVLYYIHSAPNRQTLDRPRHRWKDK